MINIFQINYTPQSIGLVYIDIGNMLDKINITSILLGLAIYVYGCRKYTLDKLNLHIKDLLQDKILHKNITYIFKVYITNQIYVN